MTSDDDVCQLTSIPDDANAESMEANGEAVANTTANSTITKEEETINYVLKISEGEPSELEKGNMTDSMRKACGDKPIEKVKNMKTDASTFEKAANGEIVDVSTDGSVRMRREVGCGETKVIDFLVDLEVVSFHFFRNSALQMDEAVGGGRTAAGGGRMPFQSIICN